MKRKKPKNYPPPGICGSAMLRWIKQEEWRKNHPEEAHYFIDPPKEKRNQKI